MKVGDKFPVTIQGHKVAEARVVNVKDGQVELKFDGHEVVMATRTEIDVAPQAAPQGQEHALLGVEENQIQTNYIQEGVITPNEARVHDPNTPATDSAQNVQQAQAAAAQPVPEAQPSPSAPVTASEAPEVKEVGDSTVVQNEVLTPEVSNDSKDNS